MELPIDHFRLLGVSPSSGPEEVLRFFQLRLDRTPDKGFTPEVISQRSELLRRSADLLCDKESREKYESALLGGAEGLEFSSNRDVAGLILLWEANISYEAFKLSRKALQPPQAPALGSGRESDLTLLAALSCRDAALQEQEQRHYSSAAELLEEGIHLLQRMGKLAEHRRTLEKELETLLPYRILDLLSRDLSDQKAHQEGLNLLDGFVLKRGGLEGKKLNHSNTELKQADFELFFQQIRKFLTVQEQIDLFGHWNKNGSVDAGFLCAISLVASGFYRRKPESLQKARKKINKLNLQGFDAMPLLGCIDLLLADLKQAEECFSNSNDIGLKEWFDTYPGEKLAALCDYSRNWLLRDVLPGFRDIEVDSVDLEAWFADRDVQDYVEKIEKKGALGIAKAGFSLISGLSAEKSGSKSLASMKEVEGSSDRPLTGSDEFSLENETLSEDVVNRDTLIENLLAIYERGIATLKVPSFNISKTRVKLINQRVIWVPLLFISMFSSGSLIGWLSIRSQLRENTKAPELSIAKAKTAVKKSAVKDEANTKKTMSKSTMLEFRALTNESPSQDQLLRLIEVWLLSKADILGGRANSNLPKVARNQLVKIVSEQRKKDEALGQKQIINAEIKSLKILDQTSKRIAVRVEIAYLDKLVKQSGEVISETSIPSLTLKYVLGRNKSQWKLIDFGSEK